MGTAATQPFKPSTATPSRLWCERDQAQPCQKLKVQSFEAAIKSWQRGSRAVRLTIPMVLAWNSNKIWNSTQLNVQCSVLYPVHRLLRNYLMMIVLVITLGSGRLLFGRMKSRFSLYQTDNWAFIFSLGIIAAMVTLLGQILGFSPVTV